MLASTVQFSNNDQPPITPPCTGEFTGAGIPKDEQRSHLQTPNSVPGRNPSGDHAFHAPESSTCKPPTRNPGRIINVPPMSNHRRTYADVMALDHQASLTA